MGDAEPGKCRVTCKHRRTGIERSWCARGEDTQSCDTCDRAEWVTWHDINDTKAMRPKRDNTDETRRK